MHTNVFQVQSFENKFTAVEGPYLNQHLGASCKLQNAKRSKNPCNKLVTAINWPGKIKTKSWQQKVDWSVCLPPCWEEKFCNKEFDGRRERADWPAAAPKHRKVRGHCKKSENTKDYHLKEYLISLGAVVTERLVSVVGYDQSETLSLLPPLV